MGLTFFGHPVSVTRFNGSLTVRRPGTAISVFLSVIDEIDGAFFRPSFAALEPWQIRREHWQLLYLAFDLAREPLFLFSSNQMAQANIVTHDDSETTIDGNAVVLEEQMSRSAEARMQFETGVALYQKGLALVRLAIRAPGR